MALNNPASVERSVHSGNEAGPRLIKTSLRYDVALQKLSFLSSLHSPHKAPICITSSKSDSCLPAVLGPVLPPPSSSHHNNPHIIEPLATDLWLYGTSDRPDERLEDESGKITQWELCDMKQKSSVQLKIRWGFCCRPSLRIFGSVPNQCPPALRHSLLDIPGYYLAARFVWCL